MQRIIRLPRSNVVVESGLLRQGLRSYLGASDRRIAIISDSNVGPLHAERLLSQYGKTFYFSAGERQKTRETVLDLQDRLLSWGVDRNCLIIGIGGGVSTDIAGYLAATLLRGVEFLSIPTSLLAMVDASVGGKTGVNTPHGKNLIGAFYDPTAVLIDPELLSTLPREHFLEGVAEMIKHGAIADKAYFQALVEQSGAIQSLDLQVLEEVILRSCEIKAAVVAEDQFERKGLRCILNFGHTIGHALEVLSAYALSHGLAVAKGMLAEVDLGISLGLTSPSVRGRLAEALSVYSMNAAMPPVSRAELLAAMHYDKKKRKGRDRSVFLQDIGCCHAFGGEYCRIIDEEEIDALCVSGSEELSADY